MKLHYQKLGSGKPFFILHGLLGMSDNWLTVGKKLADSFTVYLIDLRNFGQSPHSEEWTYPAMANDIKDLANDLFSYSPLRPFSLLGHSLGGKVAMQFASMFPEKLEKAIVVDIAPKDYPENQFAFIEKLFSVNLTEMKTKKEAEAELKKIINDNATIQLLLKNLRWTSLPQSHSVEKEEKTEVLTWKFNLKVVAENQNKIGETFRIKDRIDTPTLFIRGERSNYITDPDIPEIKKIFPNSELKTIPDAGHWVHADRPEEFVSYVKEFIK